MKIVHNIICGIKEEIHGAMSYAERYLEYKASKPDWAKRFAEMAQQELVHADYLGQIGQEKISALPWMSEDDKDAWEHCNSRVAEKTAVVKLMLSK